MNEESRILRHLIKISNNSKINKHTGKKYREQNNKRIKNIEREGGKKEGRKEKIGKEGREDDNLQRT